MISRSTVHSLQTSNKHKTNKFVRNKVNKMSQINIHHRFLKHQLFQTKDIQTREAGTTECFVWFVSLLYYIIKQEKSSWMQRMFNIHLLQTCWSLSGSQEAGDCHTWHWARGGTSRHGDTTIHTHTGTYGQFRVWTVGGSRSNRVGENRPRFEWRAFFAELSRVLVPSSYQSSMTARLKCLIGGRRLFTKCWTEYKSQTECSVSRHVEELINWFTLGAFFFVFFLQTSLTHPLFLPHDGQHSLKSTTAVGQHWPARRSPHITSSTDVIGIFFFIFFLHSHLLSTADCCLLFCWADQTS